MGKRRHQGWLASVLAFLFIAGVAALPFVLHNPGKPSWVVNAAHTSPVPIVGSAPNVAPLPDVVLSQVATPLQPGDAPTIQPVVDSAKQATLVAGEDLRLRTLLHHISRLTYPLVVPGVQQFDVTTGALGPGTPTLVLPGPASYTIADLQANGAVVPLTQGGFMLVDNVLVATGAALTLGGPDQPTLLMATTSEGFTSLVTWGGTLTLTGESAKRPFVIMGWDKKANTPAADQGSGRPYIRAVGGRLDLTYVDAYNLGFWSGRTGGVAWTGISSKDSTGGAVSSRFMNNTYGAFVSRSRNVAFKDDLFEGNELDGLRLHRSTFDATVTASAAARNGANGFAVSRGAIGNVLTGDLAINNRGNGFLIDGVPLVNGASPSGEGAQAATGSVLQASDAEANGRTGILVEGGAGTIIQGNIVCGPITGIAIRQGATQTVVIGNEVRCGGRVALSIGPAVTGTLVANNTLSNARIGMLVRNSPGVRILYNRIDGVSVFGISVRGQSPGVVGNDNIIYGRGFQAVDTRGGAETPTLVNTDITGWQHRTSLNFISSLRYHPLLTAWLIILTLVLISAVAVRMRRRPVRPYSYAVPWRHAGEAVAQPIPQQVAAAVAAPSPQWSTATGSAREPVRRAEPVAAPVPAKVLWQPFSRAGSNGAAQAELESPRGDVKAAEVVAAEAPKAVQANLAGSDGISADDSPTKRPRRTRAVKKTPGAPPVPPVPSTPAENSADAGGAPAEVAPASGHRGLFWRWLEDGGWAAGASSGQAEHPAEEEAPV